MVALQANGVEKGGEVLTTLPVGIHAAPQTARTVGPGPWSKPVYKGESVAIETVGAVI